MRHYFPAKSVHSQARSLVRFFNLSSRNVAVIWLDFKGNQIPYRILDPMGYVDVTTFVSHPWIFLDTETGDRLLANRNIIYYPQCWSETRERLPDEIAHLSEGRLLVAITAPLYSLRELSMQIVRDSITSKEAILQLEVPLSLKTDLITMFIKKQLFVEKHYLPLVD